MPEALTSTVRRSVPKDVIFSSGAPLTVAAAKDEKPPQLEMVAYSGGPMDLGWCAMYVDLEGMEVPADGTMPILRQHEHTLIAGQTHTIAKDDGKLTLKADLYDTPAGREIRDLAAKGFRWQASIGFRVASEKFQFLDDQDQKANVNGREIAGPAIIARRSRLKEASAVPLGADAATSTTVTASDEITVPTRRSKTMSDPTPAPDKKGASLQDLKAAFPKDREFALDQFEAGATVGEAKAAYADILAERLEAKEKEAEEAKKPAAPARAARLPVPVGVSAAGTAAPSAFDRWAQLVEAEVAKGVSRTDARARVARAHPDIHAAYLSEVNGREWSQMPKGAR